MLKKINYFIREMLPLRVIKTSLSVFFAATLAGVLGFESTFFAGLGAVKSMGFSVQESFETMKNQIIANAAAVIVSIVIAFTIGLSPLTAGIGIFIVISLLNYFKLNGTYVMAGITLCSIVLVSDTTMTVLQRSYDRFTLMTIGLLVSFFVNILIFRPNYQIKVDEYLRSLVTKTNQFFDAAQAGAMDRKLLTVIKSDYQLLKRYVFAAKSDESIAERFRYEHVQQLSALELYLIETDIKIKLIERLSQLDWIDVQVYQQLQHLFKVELIVETELSQSPTVKKIDSIQKVQFQQAYEQLFGYFQGYIQYENAYAHDAVRVLDLISMYVLKTEQLFTMLEQSEEV
ncbi:MAG: FUSC family protein [Culicoidibacterales bacterium]